MKNLILETLDEFATRRNNEDINNYNDGYEQALVDILEMIEADASYDEVYEYNSILSIIQRELYIEKVPQNQIMINSASYRHKNKTIYIADTYTHPDFAESLLVHELIHFFDINGFKNVNRHEINLINDKIKNLVNFQIDANTFVNVYKEVIHINKNNYKQYTTYELLRNLQIMYGRGFGGLIYLLRYTNSEIRAYIGQAMYCEEIGLLGPFKRY